MLALATKVVNDYGKILNSLDPSLYGQPISRLPHKKAQIKEAILIVFEQYGQLRPDIRHGLVHGFVYLAQFVPDEEAKIAAAGQKWLSEHDVLTDLPAVAGQAILVINRIKVEMEKAMDEITAIGKRIANGGNGLRRTTPLAANDSQRRPRVKT